MKNNHLFILVFSILLSFTIGFLAKSLLQDKKEVKEVKTVILKEIKSSNKEQKIKTDYSKILKGKFILAGSQYAGFDFINDKTVSWTNELFPLDPDTMRLKWISDDLFVATFTKFINKDNCPPRNWVRKIEFFDGNKLVIKDIWTGWDEYKDSTETFYKE